MDTFWALYMYQLEDPCSRAQTYLLEPNSPHLCAVLLTEKTNKPCNTWSHVEAFQIGGRSTLTVKYLRHETSFGSL